MVLRAAHQRSGGPAPGPGQSSSDLLSFIGFLRASPLAFSRLVRAYIHQSGGNCGGKIRFSAL
jgi:hypothetical protein